MGNWMAPGRGSGSDYRRLPLDLKRCPLCGTINAAESPECATCSWHGEFDRDPDIVEEGLFEMMVRCPELAETLIDRPRRPRRRRGFLAWLKGLFRRRVDLRA